MSADRLYPKQDFSDHNQTPAKKRVLNNPEFGKSLMREEASQFDYQEYERQSDDQFEREAQAS